VDGESIIIILPLNFTMAFYVIIRGPLGCGKSTIAESISETLNTKYFAVDRILDENNLTEDKEEGYISQKSFIRVNKIIALEAKRILERGKPIVFDGNFYWKSQIEDLIRRLDCKHYIFTLKAPVEVCIARDAQRGKTHGEDATRAVYEKSTEFNYGKVIDVNRPLAVCTKDILSNLPI